MYLPSCVSMDGTGATAPTASGAARNVSAMTAVPRGAVGFLNARPLRASTPASQAMKKIALWPCEYRSRVFNVDSG